MQNLIALNPAAGDFFLFISDWLNYLKNISIGTVVGIVNYSTVISLAFQGQSKNDKMEAGDGWHKPSIYERIYQFKVSFAAVALDIKVIFFNMLKGIVRESFVVNNFKQMLCSRAGDGREKD